MNLWYETSARDKFLNDIQARSKTTRRVMKYAAMNENSYKASIGLTSPQVLKECISCPQEIIGIEHLLDGQSAARSSLKHYHMKY